MSNPNNDALLGNCDGQNNRNKACTFNEWLLRSKKRLCMKDVEIPDQIKCVVVGDGAVGKGCLLITYSTNVFPSEYCPVLFEDFMNTIVIDVKSVNLRLCHTPGQDEYDSLRRLSYPQSDIFLLCFSLVSPSSLESITKKWLAEISNHCPKTPFLLVGTKLDLRSDEATLSSLRTIWQQEPISYEQGLQMAESIGAATYVECSSSTHLGVESVIYEAIFAVLDTKKSENSSKRRAIGKVVRLFSGK